jgi:hypothetical protein
LRAVGLVTSHGQQAMHRRTTPASPVGTGGPPPVLPRTTPYWMRSSVGASDQSRSSW